MATLFLGALGASLGASLGAGAIVGAAAQLAGTMAGSFVDKQLFGRSKSMSSESGRLEDLRIQNMCYGQMIPNIYGEMRIAGNIIWADNVKEHSHHHTRTVEVGKDEVTQTHTTYSYTVSLAIAICEGPIAEVSRIWAGDQVLSMENDSIRVYRGTEEQNPDSLIEALCGRGMTPAYRGLAYVVLENFDLTKFGNNLPVFSFEVRKKCQNTDGNVESMVKNVVIIPGSGEFVYDTVIQSKANGGWGDSNWKVFSQAGKHQMINQHHTLGQANSVIALNQMQDTLPNLEWVSVVVNWFTDSLDIDNCSIKPGVEYGPNESDTTPHTWAVETYHRGNAYRISYENGKVRYGGTVNDSSLLRYLEELKRRGYKIMLYPMLLVDVFGKTWRGRIGGSSAAVKKFFNAVHGYNRFIMHYANLTKGLIDGFIIGSEMVELNKIFDKQKQNFPAVAEFIALAQKIRPVVGDQVKISYAADWSEYHHTDGGWYHLDPLWATPEIDFIGIDAYFPLTETTKEQYSQQKIIEGWQSGEGYEFYYQDEERSIRHELGAAYAWKNIEWWWSNHHTNPNGLTTEWQPKSKKIWFTEYGFPSVDLAANQPNLFYDPLSRESGFPRYSNGVVDFIAQRCAIEATEKYWRNSEMVAKKFLWCWDARPYPTWPLRVEIWNDYRSWAYGHWVQGKLGVVTLAQLVAELCLKSGLKPGDFDVSELHGVVFGFILRNQQSVRDILEMLQQIYFFDVVERNGILVFISRKNKQPLLVDANDAVFENGDSSGNEVKNGLVEIQMLQEFDLPKKVLLNYIGKWGGYQIQSCSAVHDFTNSKQVVKLEVPIILDHGYAKHLAETILHNAWTEHLRYAFTLPIKYAYLVPGDVIKTKINHNWHLMRLTNVEIGANKLIRVAAVGENIRLYDEVGIKSDEYSYLNADTGIYKPDYLNPDTRIEVLDIPLLPNESDSKAKNRILLAACGKGIGWKGCVAEIEGGDYGARKYLRSSASIGNAVNRLGQHDFRRIDEKNELIVYLLEGKLQSIKNEELFDSRSKKNFAIVGGEIIRFRNAVLLERNKYRLQGFLRGLYGTEKEIMHHSAGDRFVLLQDGLYQLDMDEVGLFSGDEVCLEVLPVVADGGVNYDLINDKIYLNYYSRSAQPVAPINVRVETLIVKANDSENGENANNTINNSAKKDGISEVITKRLVKWDSRLRYDQLFYDDIFSQEEMDLFSKGIVPRNKLITKIEVKKDSELIYKTDVYDQSEVILPDAIGLVIGDSAGSGCTIGVAHSCAHLGRYIDSDFVEIEYKVEDSAKYKIEDEVRG